MADTQANSIRDLLVAAIQRFDATIDLTYTGRAYSTIVQPIYEALQPDMFDTDIETYLKTVLKEEYPSLELQDGDVIIDLLVRPLQLLLEPLKREINLLRKRQSTRYASQLTMADAEDLAANFFVRRNTGNYSTGTVRILLSAPTFINITSNIRFSAPNGLMFVPASQYVVTADTVSLQKAGSLYYIDVQVIAEFPGDEYNLPAGSVSLATGLSNYISVTNIFDMANGKKEETQAELLARVEQSLTERSVTTKAGTAARIRNSFSNIGAMEIIGYGDKEMIRDLLVGESTGKLLASGVSLIFGRYVLMFTGFEDSNSGAVFPSVGDKVKLNYWKFIYNDASVETNEIQEIIYNSYGDFSDLPTVHIFLLKNTPTQLQPAVGAIPSVLPAVFTSIFTETTITVSGVPNGIYSAPLPLEVATNSVHLGGRFDVWIRPTETETDTTDITITRSPFIKEFINVYPEYIGDSSLVGKISTNKVGFEYSIVTGPTGLLHREVIYSDKGTYGFITKKNIPGTVFSIINRTGFLNIGDTITGVTSGATATIVDINFTAANPDYVGYTLTIDDQALPKSFYIAAVEENYYITTEELVSEVGEVSAYIHKNTGIKNIFDPSTIVYPRQGDYTSGLQTFAMRSDVTIPIDATAFGVVPGDYIKILDGEDKGSLAIVQIIPVSPNFTKLELSRKLSRTNSLLRYAIVRTFPAVLSPLLRIPAGGISLSAAGSSYNVPYGKPIGAYALGAFANTKGRYTGLNGFVFPKLPPSFRGPGALFEDIRKQPEPEVTSVIDNAKFDSCITTGCVICSGTPITCIVTIDGVPDNYTTVKFYIEGAISSTARSYLTFLRTWLLSLVDSFFRGSNVTQTSVADDLTAFIDLFAPIIFGQPSDPNEHIISQFELCLPEEMFDDCNNVYLAIPEIDWDSEFANVTSFADAITKVLAGTIRHSRTALSFANQGDTLKIDSGANKGEYVISSVLNIPVFNGECLVTEVLNDSRQSTTTSIIEEKAYIFSIVVIRGEFPVEVFNGTSEFFSAGIPNLSSVLPQIPVNNISNTIISGPAAGTHISPFNVIEEAYTVLFKLLYVQGFDVPEQLLINPSSVLKKLTKALFNTYQIGRRSSRQTMRMLFMDPVDVTAYSPKTCKALQCVPNVNQPASITGDVSISSNTDGLDFTVSISLGFEQAPVVLTYTVTDTTSSLDALGILLQQGLDPNKTYIKISTAEFIGNPSIGTITIEALIGGAGSYLGLSNNGFDAIDVGLPRLAEGSSIPGTNAVTSTMHAHNGTRFSLTQGAEERQFIVDIEDDEDFYAAIMPKRAVNFSLSLLDLDRDGCFSAHVTDSTCTSMFFLSDGTSALGAGVLPGDLLYVHEQVNVLDTSGLYQDPFSIKKDRPIHVRYNKATNKISLLNTAGTFLVPETSSSFKLLENTITVGDYIVFEDSGDFAQAVQVSDTSIVLDRPVASDTLEIVYASGYDGLAQADTFSSVGYQFTAADVGKHLVIYGSENPGVDGTYDILSVTAGVATLSETISVSETNLHWAIVKPSFSDIAASSIDGFSATKGLLPIRIYRGIPKVFQIAVVNSFLDRKRSEIIIINGEHIEGPRRGFKQPFKILRPLEIGISANQMSSQGTSEGFYYFDVPATTLSPTFEMNIPEDTQTTPVLSTLSMLGYTLNAYNKALTFSNREQCEIVFPSALVPDSLIGTVANMQTIEHNSITISYETAGLVGNLQTFLTSDVNRNLNADVLVKHFLPSYVYLDINASGDALSNAASEIADYINTLPSTASLRVSDIEKILHYNEVSIYSHPIHINCLTVDINRDVILTRSSNRIDDDNILHDGTNRLTYFIADVDKINLSGIV